jgi:hypothetical protein
VKKIILKFILALILSSLLACAPVSKKHPLAETTLKLSKTLFANGYSQVRNIPQLSKTQNLYAAEQAAKLQAYRGLAKQLYLEQLSENTVVADQVLKNDRYRVYLDLFLREAKTIEFLQGVQQNKVALELNLTPRFYRCISSSLTIVSHCLQEDNKALYTRVGYQSVPLNTVNLSCSSSNCATHLDVSGFSTEKNNIDSTLLNYGFYDSEWTVNVALRSALRYFINTGL